MQMGAPKWGKLVSQHKEIEDHNKKTGNERKDWKFYDLMSECLDKDVTVKPTFTMESAHLVPRVFSLFNMAAAREKTLGHSDLKRSLIGAILT